MQRDKRTGGLTNGQTGPQTSDETEGPKQRASLLTAGSGSPMAAGSGMADEVAVTAQSKPARGENEEDEEDEATRIPGNPYASNIPSHTLNHAARSRSPMPPGAVSPAAVAQGQWRAAASGTVWATAGGMGQEPKRVGGRPAVGLVGGRCRPLGRRVAGRVAKERHGAGRHTL